MGEVTIQAWVERRIGGEVEVYTDAQNRTHMRMRDAEQGEDTEDGITQENGEVADEANITAEAFFENLPNDAFLDAEEQLREAVLNEIDGRGRKLSQVSNNPNVKRLSDELFAGSAADLAGWIERRIGGEIDLRQQGSDTILKPVGDTGPKRQRTR